MAEKVVRKTTRKKVATKKVTKKSTTKTVAPKKVPTKTTKKPARKAPTPVSQNNASDSRTKRLNILGFVLFFVVVGISAIIGISGGGEINIQTTINTLKENATTEERQRIESIPVQNKNALPNGGLGHSKVEKPPTPEASTASTTPSSTSTTPDLATTTSLTETASTTEVTNNETSE